jgi:hypothetical protein
MEIYLNIMHKRKLFIIETSPKMAQLKLILDPDPKNHM